MKKTETIVTVLYLFACLVVFVVLPMHLMFQIFIPVVAVILLVGVNVTAVAILFGLFLRKGKYTDGKT